MLLTEDVDPDSEPHNPLKIVSALEEKITPSSSRKGKTNRFYNCLDQILKRFTLYLNLLINTYYNDFQHLENQESLPEVPRLRRQPLPGTLQ